MFGFGEKVIREKVNTTKNSSVAADDQNFIFMSLMSIIYVVLYVMFVLSKGIKLLFPATNRH